MPNHGKEFDQYLTRLAELDLDDMNGSTRGLRGFCGAWKKASKNPVFREAQMAVADEMYYIPSQQIADELGLKTPLARGQMYDSIIQHGGYAPEYDSLPAMISRTRAYFRNRGEAETPKDGLFEQTWLQRFLLVRTDDLCHPANEDTREAWCESVSRVKSYQYAIKKKQMNFTTRLRALNNDGEEVKIRCDGSLMGTQT
ncbi:hypothetical protein HK097_009878 [Rhizophlyctis rosea]|uniref:Uncharacterized protein n=1 Tax=Rhizophlyctis rosea TaxID=64517 RepID=A0AAD5SB45_9FUNG|nr:hypothetical protein HK097_009878 [Rhizophlyctis rosea]